MKWMKLCITTTSFLVVMNGRPQGGWIQPHRGVQQGCPLAPLLFILAVDTLAFFTTKLCSQGFLTGYQVASSPGGIPLLQYVDDTTFFMMEIFSDFSRLQLNRAKSTLVGFDLFMLELIQYADILGTPIGTLPIRYLGLQLTERRLQAPDWQPILEMVEARLRGWQARLISQGGRLILLKVVLSAIPIYFMSVFRMPSGVR